MNENTEHEPIEEDEYPTPAMMRGSVMETTQRTVKTPRGTFCIHTVFSSYDEARAEGWGFWFQHYEDGTPIGIMVRDNRTGAIVEGTLNH